MSSHACPLALLPSPGVLSSMGEAGHTGSPCSSAAHPPGLQPSCPLFSSLFISKVHILNTHCFFHPHPSQLHLHSLPFLLLPKTRAVCRHGLPASLPCLCPRPPLLPFALQNSPASCLLPSLALPCPSIPLSASNSSLAVSFS